MKREVEEYITYVKSDKQYKYRHISKKRKRDRKINNVSILHTSK